MRLLLATRNVKKLDELRRILAASPELLKVELVGLDDVPPYVEVPETGLTFAENALLKAREGAKHTGLATVADDSGLAVDALNGMPGVFSARWSGRHGDDRANLDLVLAQLGDVPDEHRGASFVCAAALVLPGGTSPNGRSTWSAARWRAACCVPRAAGAASATTRSSSPRATSAPPPSSTPRRRTPSATAAKPSAPSPL